MGIIPAVLQSDLELDFLQSQGDTFDGLPNFLSASQLAADQIQFGGDIWRFFSKNKPAIAQTTDGLGDPLNYGFRTMIADQKSLFAGAANPFNLATDPSSDLGGWHLYSLQPAR